MDAHSRPDTSSLSMASADLKRKRSPSGEAHFHSAAGAPPKVPKTHNHLQINYLARHNRGDLALASTQDTMPEIVELLSQYHGVLERHESLACNLGARPLGPILIKRFERLFDGPPTILKSQGKDSNVTWLDVVEFARNKPDQFKLDQSSEGVKVCQFYTKQCRVQISEEDFVLINSGIPQKMIPPQPIVEDEEKELGTLEILEDKLSKICQLADQVAARTRQLNHRIKGRRQAILDRRATEPGVSVRSTSPSNVAMMNGNPQSTHAGFVAVNARPPADPNVAEHSKTGASFQIRHELMSKFHTLGDLRVGMATSDAARSHGSVSGPAQSGPSALTGTNVDSELAALLVASNNAANQSAYSNAGPTPTTPSAVQYHHHTTGSPSFPQAQNFGQPNSQNNQPSASRQAEKEKPDDGPYKTEMVCRMESLGKGDRVLPPCDRCRRLHMDCLKNLTACMGCTKKHAKCSWREVKGEELLGDAPSVRTGIDVGAGAGYGSGMVEQDIHSPVFENTEYRPALTSASSTATAPSAGRQAHGSHGQQQTFNTEQDADGVNDSIEKLGGFPEAVMATKNRSPSRRGSISSTREPQESSSTRYYCDTSARDPGGRDAYVSQLGNMQSRMAAYEQNPQYPSHHHGFDGTDVRDHNRQENAHRKNHDAVQTTPKSPDASSASEDVTASFLQRRLARMVEDSPQQSPRATSTVVPEADSERKPYESSVPVSKYQAVAAGNSSREVSISRESTAAATPQHRPAETAQMHQPFMEQHVAS